MRRRGGYPLNYGVIAPGDHFILIRCAEHHPYADCATELLSGNFDALGGQRPPLGSPFGRAGTA